MDNPEIIKRIQLSHVMKRPQIAQMTQIILIRIKPQAADLLRTLVGLTTNLADDFAKPIYVIRYNHRNSRNYAQQKNPFNPCNLW